MTIGPVRSVLGLALGCLGLRPSAVAATSAKMDYLPLGSVRTDPILNPDGLSAHVHTFYGAAASLRPDTSYDELRTACGNSGNVDDNKSLYWHPAIYKFDPTGRLYHTVPISFASTYYVWRTGQTRAFPRGFQMIASQVGSGGKARVKFDCNGPSPCTRSDGCQAPTPCVGTECFPTTACAELEIKIVFPACWDGVRETSTDQSHVAYASGDWGSYPVDDRQHRAYDAECPASHPVRIPEIQFYFRVTDYDGGHHLFADGDSDVHADYMSGWDVAELQQVLDRCSNPSQAGNPDAWCESFFRFRDTPKMKGDDRIIRLLKPIQPSPALDLRATVSAEPITAVRNLPGSSGAPLATLLPADPALDWRCPARQCGLLGTGSGDRSATCPGTTTLPPAQSCVDDDAGIATVAASYGRADVTGCSQAIALVGAAACTDAASPYKQYLDEHCRKACGTCGDAGIARMVRGRFV